MKQNYSSQITSPKDTVQPVDASWGDRQGIAKTALAEPIRLGSFLLSLGQVAHLRSLVRPERFSQSTLVDRYLQAGRVGWLYGLLLLAFWVRSGGLAYAQIITTVAGTGNVSSPYDGYAQATTARLSKPSGITADGSGNIYFTETAFNRISKVSSSGIITTIARGLRDDESSQSEDPSGIAVDGSGNTYVVDRTYNCIRKFTPTGSMSIAIDLARGYNPPYEVGPRGICIDRSDNLYIADVTPNTHYILKWSFQGGKWSAVGIAGNGIQGYSGDGGLGNDASINEPNGLAVDGAGNLYIIDTGNHLIRKVSPDGIITTVVGDGTAGYGGDGGWPPMPD